MEHAKKRGDTLRKKAEELLKKRGVKDKNLYDKSLEALVEELSVFQIELEEQNRELQNAQAELQKTKERYSDLYHNAPVGYMTIDEDYRIYQINQTAATMLDGTVDGIENTLFTRYIAKTYQDTFYFHLRKALESNEKKYCELLLNIHKEQQVFVQLESMHNQFNEKPVMRTVMLDITEKKLQEQRARKSEEKFRHYVENSPTSIQIIDLQGLFKYVNDAAVQQLEYSRQEMLGMYLEQLVPENKVDHFRQQFNNLKSSGRLTNQEFQVLTKSGTLKDISLNVLRFDENTFICFSTDITSQKQLQRRLAKEKKKWEQSFEAVGDGIVILNKDGTINNVNEAFETITGCTKPSCLNSPIVQVLHGQEQTPDYSPLLDDFSRPIVEEQTYWEPRLEKYLTLKASPVFRDDGSLEFAVLTVRDTTDNQKAKEALEEAKRKAEESDMLKSAFLANMSHEIRTPLNAILGFVDLIERSIFSNQDKHKFIEIVKSNGQYLLQLINDIIDIAKIESNQLDIYYDIFDLHQMLAEVAMIKQNTRAFERKSNLKLEIVNNTNTPLYIRSDEIRIKQILNNLVDNAIKFTDEGYVRIGYNLQEKTVSFFVEDTGTGIPRDKQDLVFERFGQADPKNKKAHGGTGLGLSISKGLAHLLGGEIWLKSTYGEGTTFYFTISTEFPSPSVIKSRDAGKKYISNYDFSNKTVLIAEDEQSNFLYLEALLKGTSIHIMRAESGYEVLEMVDMNPEIDLILMDLKMPAMDGLEATKKIKARKDIPIIAQTAYAFAEDKEKAMEAGCDDYIAKPIDQQLLMEKMMQQINRK